MNPMKKTINPDVIRNLTQGRKERTVQQMDIAVCEMIEELAEKQAMSREEFYNFVTRVFGELVHDRIMEPGEAMIKVSEYIRVFDGAVKA